MNPDDIKVVVEALNYVDKQITDLLLSGERPTIENLSKIVENSAIAAKGAMFSRLRLMKALDL